jgi:hypothetical protein
MDRLLWHFGSNNLSKDEFVALLRANDFTLDDIDLFLTGQLK